MTLTVELDLLFVEVAFLQVERKAAVLQSLQHGQKGSLVVLLRLPMDDDVVGHVRLADDPV